MALIHFLIFGKREFAGGILAIWA